MNENVEITWDGKKFVSATDARWAVFFKFAGLNYEYRTTGFNVNQRGYVPTFWLPDLKMWFEVLEREPTTAQRNLYSSLATQSEHDVLVAKGIPMPHEQILRFTVHGETTGPWYFADDRRNEGEFWLLADHDEFAGCSIGPVNGPDHGRPPLVLSATKSGYDAVQLAQF